MHKILVSNVGTWPAISWEEGVGDINPRIQLVLVLLILKRGKAKLMSEAFELRRNTTKYLFLVQ